MDFWQKIYFLALSPKLLIFLYKFGQNNYILRSINERIDLRLYLLNDQYFGQKDDITLKTWIFDKKFIFWFYLLNNSGKMMIFLVQLEKMYFCLKSFWGQFRDVSKGRYFAISLKIFVFGQKYCFLNISRYKDFRKSCDKLRSTWKIDFCLNSELARNSKEIIVKPKRTK